MFYSECRNLTLMPCGETTFIVNFIPFCVGKYQCSLIITNENIGEMLYLINGTAILPLPEVLPPTMDANTARISSAAANGWSCLFLS